MGKHLLVAGTRGSALALWQTRRVAGLLQAAHPGLEVRMRTIRTRGDAVADRPLPQVGGKGLFVTEIEDALAAGEIDLAVHSLKDMPTEQPEGLVLGAILERADARDALLVRGGAGDLWSLPEGARVGTSSLRRQAQLLAVRPDLRTLDLRGNVDTRLQKLQDGQYDAIVLAVAGLERLGLAGAISQVLPPEVVLPAVGQGALCVEVRAGDAGTRSLVAALDHAPTRRAAEAERALLRRLSGGCQAPVAAYARPAGGEIVLQGLVAAPDGTRLVRDEIRGPAADAEGLGTDLGGRLLAAGGAAILEELGRANGQ